jgi:hypothetical protein
MQFSTLVALVPILGQLSQAAAVPVAQISTRDIVTIVTYKDANRGGASQSWSLATQTQCSTPSHTSSHDT